MTMLLLMMMLFMVVIPVLLIASTYYKTGETGKVNFRFKVNSKPFNNRK